jgi:hypothetical protein
LETTSSPALIDALSVVAPAVRVCRVVALDSPVPGAGLLLQPLQIACTIGDIPPGLECLVQAGEGVGVVHQVDLHAADVDVALARGPQSLDMCNSFALGGEVATVARIVDGPRPSRGTALVTIVAARFGDRDRGQ